MSCIFSIISFFLVPAMGFAWTPIPPDAPGYEWMDRILDDEFAAFEKSGITQEMIDTTERLRSPDGSMYRFKVIDSNVYGPGGIVREILNKLVQVYKVPDVDFIYFSHDILRQYTLENEGLTNSSPIFISAKKHDFDRAIAFIYWYYSLGMSELNAIIHNLQNARNRWPWEQKIEKVFWRGAATDGCYHSSNWTQIPRGHLVYLSKYIYPDLIDARFNKLPQLHAKDHGWFRQEIGMGGWADPVDHMQFKYQIVLDGITSTYPGTHWRLFTGCLTFKQETDDVMWFYKELIPWKHYVPVAYDLSDLMEKVEWAKSHDAEAKQIAMNAKEFAETHLMPEHVLLYCYKALLRYASLQKFQPTN